MVGDLRFDDRVVLVTGAAGGLGRAAALGFAERGAHVGAIDRDEQGLASLAAAGVELGVDVHPGAFDVRDVDAVATYVEGLMRRFGRLDVVVNNAGGTFRALFDDVSAKGEAALVAENFGQVTAVLHACSPHLRRGAAVVNVTSIEAHRAAPQFAVYAAMKAAVENLSRSLAVEWGHRGVRVNVVAPDAIPTGGEAALAADVAAARDHTTPLDRLGEPADIVGPILFLASDLAGFVTGTTLHVDGGNDAARGWRRRPDGTFEP